MAKHSESPAFLNISLCFTISCAEDNALLQVIDNTVGTVLPADDPQFSDLLRFKQCFKFLLIIKNKVKLSSQI